MIICDSCKKETMISYAVTVKGYADVELCAECQERVEMEAWEKDANEMKCKDCGSISISHETADGEYIYICQEVTTGNGGTTHPVVSLENEECYLGGE